MARILLKRAYEKPDKGDGVRVLVDRLWPRGLGRDDLSLDAWLKEIAPSDALRRWYGHDPQKWQEFRRRYFTELAGCKVPVEELLSKVRTGPVTLVFAARDERHNNAVALKEYLEALLNS